MPKGRNLAKSGHNGWPKLNKHLRLSLQNLGPWAPWTTFGRMGFRQGGLWTVMFVTVVGTLHAHPSLNPISPPKLLKKTNRIILKKWTKQVKRTIF